MMIGSVILSVTGNLDHLIIPGVGGNDSHFLLVEELAHSLFSNSASGSTDSVRSENDQRLQFLSHFNLANVTHEQHEVLRLGDVVRGNDVIDGVTGVHHIESDKYGEDTGDLRMIIAVVETVQDGVHGAGKLIDQI